MRSALLCCSFLWTVWAGAVDAADWPAYLNGNTRQGATAETLALPLQPQWVYSAPSPPRLAWAGPDDRTIEGHALKPRMTFDKAFHVAVAGERVYFGSSVDHKLYCRDIRTGEELWSFFTDGPVRLAPTVWNGRVLFGTDDGRVYCLDAADGKLIWKLRAGPADEWFLGRGEMISRWPVRTGVLVADGIAYFGAGIFPHEDVYLYAVNAEDGTIVWKRDNISESDAGRDDLSPQGYFLANEQLLFVPSGRSLPAAVDRRTGKVLHKRVHGWRGAAGGVVGGTRALLADGQIYTAGEHHLLAMDQETGNVGFGYFDGLQMAVSGKSAYTINGARVARLDRMAYAEASLKRHALQTQVTDLQRKLSSAGDKADEMRARIAAGKEELAELAKVGVMWEQPTAAESALIVAGDLVVAGGQNQVEAFDASTGKKMWSAKADGEAAGLAVANGRLFVSTSAGNVYCFGPDASKADGPPVTERSASPYPKDEHTALYEKAAEEILRHANVRSGFCLVVGSEEGRLAYELARRSELKIYAVEPNGNKVRRARQALSAAGVYGSRVTVHQTDLGAIPYSNFFANLIVSDTLLLTGELPAKPQAIARHLKPIGGVICIGRPADADGTAITADEQRAWLAQTELDEQGEIRVVGAWATLTRGKLPGAGSWSHQYGEPGNTASSGDQLVKGGLGVLWYGDPGPGKMVNRHDGAVGPLAINGRLFAQGENSIMAYDAYNGQFLWERENPEALRTGVFQNQNPGNLVAGEDSLFEITGDKCVEFDAATGEVKATYGLPPSKDGKTHVWGYVAYRDGVLFGTATVRKELEARLRRRGRAAEDATDTIFALDTKSGKHLWSYQGKNISHYTIALGPDRVFFIDSSITTEQRDALLRQDKSELKDLPPEEAKKAEERMKRLDVRLAVALDAATGNEIWSKPVDVTDCSEIGIGGGKLTLIHQNNVLVLCGANANGHYWTQFLSGDFSRRRLVALSGEDGHKLWAKDANYRHRPIVIEDRIIAEPWAFDLYTGAQQMRSHPLTGEQVPWSMIRPGHHCGMLTGCPSMLMFRSGSTGFYDLEADSGTRHFAGHRLGCWINAIPANGLVMVPESSAGCVCLFSIASTIVMEPREARRPWSIYSAIGAATPVKHMALNLGAPGDRRDARGTVWLAYPRPEPYKVTGLDLPLKLQQQFQKEGGFKSQSSQSTEVGGHETSWLFSSWAEGLTRCMVPLLGNGDEPAAYTVKLYFAELDEKVQPGERVFDVKLQGAVVLEGIDIADAGGRRTAVVREVIGVRVTDNLLLELVPRAESAARDRLPVLSALEIVRSNSPGTERAGD